MSVWGGANTLAQALYDARRERSAESRVEYWNKKKYLLPALQYDVLANFENPELYAVFPYRLFGVGKPDLEMGRETYARRLYKVTGCWRQDAIQAALLGSTDEAKRDVTRNFSGTHPSFRFPAIWGRTSTGSRPRPRRRGDDRPPADVAAMGWQTAFCCCPPGPKTGT